MLGEKIWISSEDTLNVYFDVSSCSVVGHWWAGFSDEQKSF